MSKTVSTSIPAILSTHGDKQLTGSFSPVTSSALPQLKVAAWAERLRVTLQAQMMTEYLEPLLAPLVGSESTVRIQKAQLLDCKPGQRALIQYELAGTKEEQSRKLLGKLYAEPSQALRVHGTMRYLWHEVFSRSASLGIPQPLGIVPNLCMLVYLPAEGHFLDEVITKWWQDGIADHQATDWMALAGYWLAHLHQHHFALEKHFQLMTELANVAAWAALVNQTYPETVAATARILSYLQAWAPSVQLVTQTPIHKDFHYRHIIVNRQVVVIDFDEMRLGDPTFDLAHFCMNLHLLHYRKHPAPQQSPHQLAMLQRAFLDAYANQTSWVQDERFVYFSLYTCLKIAKQLCTGRGPDPRPIGEERRRQVEIILDQGLKGVNGEW